MDRAREKEWATKSHLRENDLTAKGINNQHDKRVLDLKWRHRIPLLNGQVTPGNKDTARDLEEFKWSRDLFEGKTVIDVGACDGFFSFHSEKMGATKVLGVDPYRWTLDDRWSGMSGFNLAREILDSKVEDSVVLLEDLSPQTVGEWDVSLFLGVFYHLVNPIQILKNVASVTKDTIVVETINAEYHSLRTGAPCRKTPDGKSVMFHDYFVNSPMLTYYPNDEVDGDYTTWYAPNPAYIESFLRTEGFNKFDTKRIYSGSRFITIATR